MLQVRCFVDSPGFPSLAKVEFQYAAAAIRRLRRRAAVDCSNSIDVAARA
jgi:hypothetical protein